MQVDMRVLNLFDGIGGFGLAAKWMGWENVASCEIDPYCRRVLDYWFDYKYIYDDIKTTDFTPLRGNIDLVTGGFPCQPFSLAGKQLGEKDDRYLWPHMLRAIREVRPRWVVAENVRGLITQSDGMVFEQVCSDLEACGYEVQSFVIPACAVNAPHRRDRLWIVAHRADARAESVREREDDVRASVDTADAQRGGSDQLRDDLQPVVADGARPDCDGDERDVTYSDGDGGQEKAEWRHEAAEETVKQPESILYRFATPDRQGAGLQSIAYRQREWESRGSNSRGEQLCFERFPTQPPVCRRDDGISDGLVGITFPKWREQTIKMFGNAVVPQIPYQIFRAIEQYEKQTGQ